MSRTGAWIVFVERSLCRKVKQLVVRNYQGSCKRLTTGDSLHMVFGRRGQEADLQSRVVVRSPRRLLCMGVNGGEGLDQDLYRVMTVCTCTLKLSYFLPQSSAQITVLFKVSFINIQHVILKSDIFFIFSLTELYYIIFYNLVDFEFFSLLGNNGFFFIVSFLQCILRILIYKFVYSVKQ